MTVDFDFDEYCKARKTFSKYAMPYLIIDGINCYLSDDAPEEAKEAYKNSLYWSEKKSEWERVTGEHFR